MQTAWYKPDSRPVSLRSAAVWIPPDGREGKNLRSPNRIASQNIQSQMQNIKPSPIQPGTRPPSTGKMGNILPGKKIILFCTFPLMMPGHIANGFIRNIRTGYFGCRQKRNGKMPPPAPRRRNFHGEIKAVLHFKTEF